MLQLLDLVQVVNEGLADLFDKQWSIGNLELHLLLDLLEVDQEVDLEYIPSPRSAEQ